MSDSRYDNYRYDDHSRRTVRAGSAADHSSEYRSRRSGERYTRAENGHTSPGILYDARGVRIRKSRFAGGFLHTLLFFVLPYLVFNSIVFLLVTSTPKIDIRISDTDDYRSVTAEISIRSLLPLKETVVTLGSEEIPVTKSGSSLTAVISKNGTLLVEATAVNSMSSKATAEVSVLDDTPPEIRLTGPIENGILPFHLSDSQSGVDWDSIYGIQPDGSRVLPDSIDRDGGNVQLPMTEDRLELHFADMVGNELIKNVTASTEELTDSGPVTE